jgi:pimeloyl-ACP methyl ester carboxylesterase
VTQPRTIQTEPGLVFDVLVDGPTDAPLVLLLHGFAGSHHMWRSQLRALAAAGYCAIAPNQRGYSPGARPDPAVTANYQFDRLAADAMNVAAACGHASVRFHLVGHDWGASIAWGLVDRYPDRIASLTVLSRPHPNAFNNALHMPDGEQASRSRHHKAFLEPDAVAQVLQEDARWLRERWAKSGVSTAAAQEYLTVLGNEPAMQAAMAWYRARGAIRAPLGVIGVPVLYVWGDADDTVGRAAAEGTRDFVSGAYRFEILPGAGHFVADQAPDRINELLLAHLARHPA